MKNYYQRNLPHYQPYCGEFFITFRLANSLPKNILSKLRSEYRQLLKEELPDGTYSVQKKYFAKFDRILDQSKREKSWLKENKIAEIVADNSHDFDQQKYLLICYCIMPNHVHLLFKLPDRDESRSTYPVANILRLMKGATAREANLKLGRTGSFWQNESYDHLVRN